MRSLKALWDQRRQSRVVALIVVVAVCSTLATAAYGAAKKRATYNPAKATWRQTLAEAKREGSVTLYLSMANFDTHLEKVWAKAYPNIKLNVFFLQTGALSTKLSTEIANGNHNGADVADTSGRGWFDNNINQLAPLYGPAAALYRKNRYVVRDRIFTPQVTGFVFANNTKVLQSVGAHVVSSWNDLLQPQLHGLVTYPVPSIAPVWGELWWVLYKAKGIGFLQQLAKTNPRFIGNYNAVAAGDVGVDLGGVPVSFATAMSSGAPLRLTPMENPEFPIVYSAGIIKEAPHPAAAQVLMNWLVSRAGQTAQHSWGLSGSILPHIKGAQQFNTKQFYDGVLTPAQKDFLQNVWTPLFRH